MWPRHVIRDRRSWLNETQLMVHTQVSWSQPCRDPWRGVLREEVHDALVNVFHVHPFRTGLTEDFNDVRRFHKSNASCKLSLVDEMPGLAHELDD